MRTKSGKKGIEIKYWGGKLKEKNQEKVKTKKKPTIMKMSVIFNIKTKSNQIELE